MFTKLRSLLTKRDKQFLVGLLFFSIVVSIVETIGITAIMPFMAVAIDFNVIHSHTAYRYVFDLFGFTRDSSFVIAFGVLLIFFYFFRSGLNLAYFYLMARFTNGRYHLIAYRLFENYLGMPYHAFVVKNSSTLTKSIVSEALNLTMLISGLLLMLSELFIVILIYAMMLWVNYKITLVLTAFLLLNAVFMLKTVSGKIKKAGLRRSELQKSFFEHINRSFGNFKLLKLRGNDREVLQEFADASRGFAHANMLNQALSHVPRLFLEAIGFSIIVAIITYLVWRYDNGVASTLSLISMFVLALYRLMPSVNRIMSSYNLIIFHRHALDIIHNDLMYASEQLGDETVSLHGSIAMKNVSFAYEAEKPVFTHLNLSIRKGEKVAFVGESGSGKSTLVDLLIGLYRPTSGQILIDGEPLTDRNVKAWRSGVGYIPQSVYLFDGSVGENVAFEKYYDRQRVDECLKKAKIYDFLQTKKGQDTHVGEGGVLLSGGQKQRIAIARALYTDPEILVLDEATSALDAETEMQIMEEIYEVSRDKTLIIIAHRLSTIERCQTVYELADAKLSQIRKG